MLKRSKSKEAGGSGQIVGGSQTQRINPANGDTASFGPNIPGNHGQRNNFPVANGNSASKSIFNASLKELKPSKSVDLTQSLAHNGGDTGIQNSFFMNEETDNFELFLFKPSEKVE